MPIGVYVRKKMAWQERLWNGVRMAPGNGCWEWQKYKRAFGYGVMSLGNGKTDTTHRLAYLSIHKEIPAGMHVLHRCDNPPCCRPDHLFIGANIDNVADRVKKRRSSGGRLSGEAHPNSKLTEAQVIQIRLRYITETSSRPKKHVCQDLAKDYGLTFGGMRKVVEGRKWTKLQGEPK